MRCSTLLSAFFLVASAAVGLGAPVSTSASEIVERSEDLEKRGYTLASGKTTYQGKATWYTQDGNAGSCGKYNKDSAIIVAVNTPQVANGGHCGKYVIVQNTSNKKTIKARVADECPGCGYGSLDLSTAAFKQLGNLDTGVLKIKWQWA